MFNRSKMLLGFTTAALLIAGVAWAGADPQTVDGRSEAVVTDHTVVPIDGVGVVTLEEVAAGLSLVSAVPEEGWTVEVEQSLGLEVEVAFENRDRTVDVRAELEDAEIRVDIRRTSSSDSSTTTLITTTSAAGEAGSSTTVQDETSTTVNDNTSTTVDESTSTTFDDSTSTTVEESTSTTFDDSTSTTVDSSTSTTVDESTSTTIDDSESVIADGTRTFEVSGAATVTIQVASGQLVLAGIDLESGWTAEIDKAEPDEIRIEFESTSDAEAELRVRIHNGDLEVETRRD